MTGPNPFQSHALKLPGGSGVAEYWLRGWHQLNWKIYEKMKLSGLEWSDLYMRGRNSGSKYSISA